MTPYALPSRRTAVTAVGALCLSLALTGVATVMGSGSPAEPATARAAVADAAPLDRLAQADVGQAISALQKRLKVLPRDDSSWATLGQAYIEQARTTADPTRYPQAEQAFRTSLKLRPDGNIAAVAGQASLAAARHDFSHALGLAEQALKLDPYSESALSVRIDALVELGRYDDAYQAAKEADERRPGIPVFTRCAYVLELRGDTAGARRVLLRAQEAAFTPSDRAYVANALGDLARSTGDRTEALRQYAVALHAVPGYLPSVEGRARTHAAQGDLKSAVADMTTVVRRMPLPDKLEYLGDLYTVLGDQAAAKSQYAVTGSWVTLAKASGVATDLETALAAAEHGQPAEALRAARAEWSRRHSVHVADAYAWALHASGDDRQALEYAHKANGVGYRNALFLYHQGMIEKALGRKADAERDLRKALDLDPGFSPLGAQRARAALTQLTGKKS